MRFGKLRGTVLVTGASGFIGSYLCEVLSRNSQPLTAVDRLPFNNLSESIKHRIIFKMIDLASDVIPKSLLKDTEVVFHLAANPEVRLGFKNTDIDFEDNIVATRNLLESLKKSGFRGTLVFSSTSTVYGEPEQIPTPESYGPLVPVSLYGASKLACESLILAYAKLFGFNAKILRLANVVGGTSRHGVIFDFVSKLKMDPSKLEVLGDGTQSKSYVHISDCVEGALRACSVGADTDIFNLGTKKSTSVKKIAEMVVEEMGLRNVNIRLGAGNGKDGRGWPGDVKHMLLDCTKLSGFGWKYRFESDEAVRKSVKDIIIGWKTMQK